MAYARSCMHHAQRGLAEPEVRQTPQCCPIARVDINSRILLPPRVYVGGRILSVPFFRLPPWTRREHDGRASNTPAWFGCAATTALAEARELVCLLRCSLFIAIQTSTHCSSDTQRQRCARIDISPDHQGTPRYVIH